MRSALGDENRHRETMLIVDDDVINRVILNHIFSPYYSIQEAENGRTGLEERQLSRAGRRHRISGKTAARAGTDASKFFF